MYGCGGLSKTEELKYSISKYYAHEKNKQWNETYKMRDSEFRRVVDVEDYIETMRRDSKGWKLIKYEIVNINVDNDKAYVKMRFLEEVPESQKNISASKSHRAYFNGVGIWEYQDRVWDCVDAISRGHFSLNINIK